MIWIKFQMNIIRDNYRTKIPTIKNSKAGENKYEVQLIFKLRGGA